MKGYDKPCRKFYHIGVIVMLTGDYPVIAGGQSVGSLNISQNGLMTVFDCTCNYMSQDVFRLAAVCGGKYVPLGVMMPEAGVLRLKKSCTKNTLAGLSYLDTDIFHLIRNGDVYSQKDEIQDVRMATLPPVAEEDNGLDERERFSEPVQNEANIDPKQSEPEQKPEMHALFPDPMPSEPEPTLQVQDDKPLLPPSEPDIMPTQSEMPAINGWHPIAQPRILFNDPGIAAASEEISGALTLERDGILHLAVPLLPDEPFPMMPVFCFGNSEEIGDQEYLVFKISNGNLTL